MKTLKPRYPTNYRSRAFADPPRETPVATHVTIGGRELELSRLDKVLYPAANFTKAAVIDYYLQIAPVLLPHLKDRPLTLKRYPDGVGKPYFYEKRCPSYRPKWVQTASVWSKTNEQDISYCLANDPASLVWMANLASLELHASLARFQRPGRPTAVVFDLDPGPEADILDCAQTALWLHGFLNEHRLWAYPKTSGSKGLQIYVPLNTAVTFDQTKQFARWVAELLSERHPDKVLSQMARRLRTGKVFIDWSQNDHHKTTICAYSLRATDHPAVSTPLQWSEVKSALKTRAPKMLTFEPSAVLERVEKHGDLFSPVLELEQNLPDLA